MPFSRAPYLSIRRLYARGLCVSGHLQDLGYCDMVDYKVYDNLDIPEAQKRANEIGEMHTSAWRCCICVRVCIRVFTLSHREVECEVLNSA